MKAKAANLPVAAVISGAATLAIALAALAAPGTPSAPPAAAPPSPLARGPIATYDAACARCHGPNGSFYGPGLGKGKTDAELRQVIKEMAEGPSQLPDFPPLELEAQTAYHRALIKAEPFVALTGRTSTLIKGEVTSGAVVSVRVGGKTTTAKVDGSQWTVPLPAVGAAPLVTAKLVKATTILDTACAAFSHGAPLAAGDPAKNESKPITGKPNE